MKLILQLVVVVLNAPTKFRDNLFRFTLYTIIIHNTRWEARDAILTAMLLSNTTLTATENKHARIVEIR